MIQQYYLVGIANPVIWILSFAGQCRVFCLGFKFKGLGSFVLINVGLLYKCVHGLDTQY